MNIKRIVSDTQALRDLLAKVEAGADHITILELAGNWAYAHGHAGLYVYVIDAYNGSLDAAKALHDAVLPGWDLQICTYEDDLFEVSVSKPTSVTTHDGLSEIISRAWLICILRALIAQATP